MDYGSVKTEFSNINSDRFCRQLGPFCNFCNFFYILIFFLHIPFTLSLLAAFLSENNTPAAFAIWVGKPKGGAMKGIITKTSSISFLETLGGLVSPKIVTYFTHMLHPLKSSHIITAFPTIGGFFPLPNTHFPTEIITCQSIVPTTILGTSSIHDFD